VRLRRGPSPKPNCARTLERRLARALHGRVLVPSAALTHWLTRSGAELDEFENAHRKVCCDGPGRKYLTGQLNAAYLVAVAAQFQRFCRDLHSEAAQRIAGAASPAPIQVMLLRVLTESRRLDHGNANESTLGSDFARFGMKVPLEGAGAARPNALRRRRMEQLNVWRNAIVHQNFKLKPHHEEQVRGTTPYHVLHVRQWRGACGELAVEFDRMVRAHVDRVVGGPPWE
jgi:hypothetical protein